MQDYLSLILPRINEPAAEEHHLYQNYSTNEDDLQRSKLDILVGCLGMLKTVNR